MLPLSGPLLPKGSKRSILGSDADTENRAKELWGEGSPPRSPSPQISLPRDMSIMRMQARVAASAMAIDEAEADQLELAPGTSDLYGDPHKALLEDGVFKETLSQVQKSGQYFHGFTDAEIDAMFPFLHHFPFSHGDVLAKQGEDAGLASCSRAAGGAERGEQGAAQQHAGRHRRRDGPPRRQALLRHRGSRLRCHRLLAL